MHALDINALHRIGDDAFMQGPIDRRLHDELPTDMWRETLSYLHPRDVVPALPRTSRYLNSEVVWHPWSRRNMWGRMEQGNRGLGDTSTRRRLGNMTMLSRAIRHAPLEQIKVLIANGEQVNVHNGNGHTPLSEAISHGRVDVVRLLLSYGADPNELIYYQMYSPLTLAMTNATHGIEIIDILLDHPNIDVNKRIKDGNTALMYAAEMRYMSEDRAIEAIRLLVEKGGADLMIKNDFGKTAFAMTSRIADQLNSAAVPQPQ